VLDIDPWTTSRVEVEHYMAALIVEGDRAADVEQCRAALAARTWQWHNPYLVATTRHPLPQRSTN
jgi:hypothetical protein